MHGHKTNSWYSSHLEIYIRNNFCNTCFKINQISTSLYGIFFPFVNKPCQNTASLINPLPDMPILGPSNLGSNKDMMSKIWTNGDTII